MPKLCFKPRANSLAIQLVRHVYSPTAKRSRTVNVGSVRLHAEF